MTLRPFSNFWIRNQCIYKDKIITDLRKNPPRSVEIDIWRWKRSPGQRRIAPFRNSGCLSIDNKKERGLVCAFLDSRVFSRCWRRAACLFLPPVFPFVDFFACSTFPFFSARRGEMPRRCVFFFLWWLTQTETWSPGTIYDIKKQALSRTAWGEECDFVDANLNLRLSSLSGSFSVRLWIRLCAIGI